MVLLIGEIIGGLGLFFVGMWLISENLKSLSTRRIRGKITSPWLTNRLTISFYGALAGGVTQNAVAVTFITIGVLRANLISIERAYPFVIGANIGVVTLVFFVSFSIDAAALYFLAFASIVMLSDRTVRYRSLGTVLFGVALVFIGLSMIKGSAGSLSVESWFEDLLQVLESSLWISFFLACILRFIVQSAVAVMVLAISMSSSGLLTAEQVMMVIYGANLGAVVTTLVLSTGLSGVSRRLAMFHAMFNVGSCLVFVPMLYIEIWTGIPLMKALISAVPLEAGGQLGLLALLTDVFTGIALMIAMPLVMELYSRRWPATEEESVSRVKYIHGRSYGDVATALQLAALEQRSVLSGLSSYLDTVRQGRGIDSLGEGVRPVIREIDDFLAEVRKRHPGHLIEEVNSMIARQRLVGWLEERFAELCADLDELPNDEAAGQLRDVMIDGIDAITLSIMDELTGPNPGQWSMPMYLRDPSELLRRIRGDSMLNETAPRDSAQASVLKVTNTASEIFSLFSRLAREMRDYPVPAVDAGS